MFEKMYVADGTAGGRRRRGFAAMDPEQQRAIASKGGRVVSENRDHMATIGRKGGVASHSGGRPASTDGRDGGQTNSR